MEKQQRHDSDESKGAVEQETRSQPGNTSLEGQLPHRAADPVAKDYDTDFPEPGESPEHSGQLPEVNPEAAEQTEEPGDRQKRNQGDQKDDPLAA